MKELNILGFTFVATLLLTTAKAQETAIAQDDEYTLGAYEKKDLMINITAGWVAKEWTTRIGGKTLHEDFWGNPNKMLHGLQLGISASKGLFHGLGYRSGLYYEWYMSRDKCIRDMGYERFNEHNLYVPLQVMYRINTRNKKISFTPFCGIGFNWAIYGSLKSGPMTDAFGDKYKEKRGPFGYYTVHEGRFPLEKFDYNNHSPHHWNVQAEVGIGIRLWMVEVTCTYSRGLNHHRLYDEASSRQNKLAVNLSYVLPAFLFKD